MTNEEREELIERMAQAALESDEASRWCEASEAIRNIYLREAHAALAVAEPVIREECARAAEGFEANRDWVSGSLWGNIRREVAAAIREGEKGDGKNN